MVRMTHQINETSGKKTAGIRCCDSCQKEESLLKPRRWDVCSSCEKREGIASGRRKKAPVQVKRQSYINYCAHCKSVFEVKSRLYQFGDQEQKHCSSKCAGLIAQVNDCLDCGVKCKNARCEPCRIKNWHKTAGKERYKEKYDNDTAFHLSTTIRNRLKAAIRVNIKGGKNYTTIGDLEELCGCSIPELILHIEKAWEADMTWDTYGLHGWHLDHIIPLSAVNLEDIEQRRIVCHYTNLRPMWAKDNLRKHDKIVEADLYLLDEKILQKAKELIDAV